MKREEELLRQALEELAQEETDELEGNLSRSEIRQAEELYRHHRRAALSLIRKNTRKVSSPVYTYLRIAAAVAVVVGLVVFSLNRSQPDNIIQVQPPASSVAPYYSPAPVDSPASIETAAPVTPEPTVIPSEESKDEIIPTETQIFDGKEMISPTFTPNLTEIPTALPTIVPQATETPTEVPTPTPTLRPTAEPTAAPDPVVPTEIPVPTAAPGPVYASVPESWGGSFFPFSLPADGTYALENGDGWQRVTWHSGGQEWIFTEYDRDDLLDVPEEAEISYVQWDDIVALRLKDASGVTLSWVQEGHSLSLRSTSGDEMELAQSVRKIGR